jgi:predicted solute-binding protein
LLYWSFNVLVQTVPKLRISIVQYLNTAPLVWGFTNGPLHGKYDLDFTVPSQCAEALRSGAADIAIIPAIEYQRIDDLVVLPGFAIASKNRVRSLLLVSKKPIAEVQSIALDSSSRSTQALVRILCADAWKISPRFFEATPVAQEMLQHADAALLIGDPALRLAVAVESATSLSTGPAICRGASVGLPGHRTLFVYDMVEEWRNATGLPAVLAVWAARPDVVTAEVLADFAASRDFGLARIAEISTAASRELELSPVILASYLNTNIDFSLDGENRRGLEHFYARAAALNLIPSAKSINWATATASLAKLTL